MVALSCILASGVFGYLPLIVLAVFGIVALIAFLIGLKKGFRRVSWTGATWLFSGIAFFFIWRKWGGVLGAKLNTIFSRFPLREGAISFVSAFAFAAACILVMLIFSGIFSLIFRPHVRWRKKRSDRYSLDYDGVEYDEEYEDYDDYEQYETRKEQVKKGYGTPSFFGRILGALCCTVNVLMILSVAFGIFMLMLGETAYKNGALSVLFAYRLGNLNVSAWAYGFAQKYAFDFLLLGILVLIAYVGRKNGFMSTIRILVVKVGGVVGVLACFYIPFSAMAGSPADGGIRLFHVLVNRCANGMTTLFGVATVGAIVGKIVAGLVLLAFLIVVLLIVNFLLKKLVKVINGVGFFRVIDGSLSAVAYLLVGVLVCVVLWAGFFLLSYYGIFEFDVMFAKGSVLSSSLLDACEAYLKPLLENLQSKIAGLLSA